MYVMHFCITVCNMYYVYLITYINISLKQSVYIHYLLYTEYLHVLHP